MALSILSFKLTETQSLQESKHKEVTGWARSKNGFLKIKISLRTKNKVDSAHSLIH